jgi:hypothetical protein
MFQNWPGGLGFMWRPVAAAVPAVEKTPVEEAPSVPEPSTDPQVKQLLEFYDRARAEGHVQMQQGFEVLSPARSEEFQALVEAIVRFRNFDEEALTAWLHNKALDGGVRRLLTDGYLTFAALARMDILEIENPRFRKNPVELVAGGHL